MPNYIATLQGLYESYKSWVTSHPQFVSDLETTIKWVSYFVAGRISNSSVLSELIYSLSNLLVLFNDRIIEKAHNIATNDGRNYQIKLMLSSLEYSEVFIEISSAKLWGERGRWLCIVAVQVLKCIERFLLTNRFSEEISRIPPIRTLDRKKISTIPSVSDTGLNVQEESTFSFKLKRSGRLVRKVEGAPSIHLRNWKPLDYDENAGPHQHSKALIKSAEALYIAKPLIHLGSIGLFGYKNWKSYSVALLIDLASIRLYYNNRHLLSKEQKVELSRRCVNMLLYFVRSPIYEKTTQKRLNSFLNSIARTIPLTKGLCNPLIQYIPQWQGTYFYMWSS